MDSLSSTEFRKSYARLTGPVLVTVHGHVIGEWSPRLGTAPAHSRELARFAKNPDDTDKTAAPGGVKP